LIELDEVTIKVVLDELKLNSVEKLQSMSEKHLTDLRDSGKLAFGDVAAIERFKVWMTVFSGKDDSHQFPDSLESWKEKFTYESYVQSGGETPKQGESGKSSDVIVSGQESSFGDIRVRISDYPEFSGNHQDWYMYRTKQEGMARVHGYSDVLHVNDEEAHLARRATDREYDAKVKNMYAVLQVKTAEDTAGTKVTKLEATQDGALAWKYLKDYYDQEGDKVIFESK